MELIGVDAECKVTRETGEVDQYDNLIAEEVYKGQCRYQEGVQAYLGTSIRNSVVFIYKHVKVFENDKFEITTEMVHKRGIAKTVRYVKFPLTGEQLTRVELIQVKDVTEDEDVEG